MHLEAADVPEYAVDFLADLLFVLLNARFIHDFSDPL
jgi:hypothetical protein